MLCVDEVTPASVIVVSWSLSPPTYVSEPETSPICSPSWSWPVSFIEPFVAATIWAVKAWLTSVGEGLAVSVGAAEAAADGWPDATPVGAGVAGLDWQAASNKATPNRNARRRCISTIPPHRFGPALLGARPRIHIHASDAWAVTPLRAFPRSAAGRLQRCCSPPAGEARSAMLAAP